MELRYIASTKLAFGVMALFLLAQIYQAATRPIGSDEAYLYDRFVRPTTRQILSSELPDHDVLYGLLEKRSVGLFHVSPLAVRLPSILFAILYLWSIWQVADTLLGPGWWCLAGAIVAGVLPLRFGWFDHADGTGAALTLLVCAVAVARRRKHLIGIFLGLSICSKMAFLIPAALVALALLAIQRRWEQWSNQVLIPAAVTALILLVLPLSHAHATPETTPELTTVQATRLQSALDTLRASAGSDHVRIAAIPAAEPIVNFYRAQHRATTWERARRDYLSEAFDYYLLSASDSDWAEQRHLIVVHRDADFLLARRGSAAM
jgi:hypothetical protein